MAEGTKGGVKKPFIEYESEFLVSDEYSKLRSALLNGTIEPYISNIMCRCFSAGFSAGQKFLLENDFVIKEQIMPFGKSPTILKK